MYESKFYNYIIELVEDYIEEFDTPAEGYSSIIHDLGQGGFLQVFSIYRIDEINQLFKDYFIDILGAWDEELKYLINEPEFEAGYLIDGLAGYLASAYCQGRYEYN